MSSPPLEFPYAGRLTIEPYPDLPDDHRSVERQLAELVQDEAASDRKYADILESQGGKIINIDYYRNLIPRYAGVGADKDQRRRDRTALTLATYNPAKIASRERFLRAIRKPGLEVTVIGGGPASGKSTAVAAYFRTQSLPENALVYDTSLANPKHCIADIHETLRRQDGIDLYWVYCPFGAAIHNMAGRARIDGRYLTLSRMVATHQGSRASILRVMKEFGSDPRANIFPIVHTPAGEKAQEFNLARLEEELYATQDEVAMNTANSAFDAYLTKTGSLPEDLHDAIRR